MIRRQTVLTVFNLCNVNFCCKKYLILSHSCIYNELPFLCNICILRSINGLLLLLLLATPRHDNPAFKKPCHCKWETYQSFSLFVNFDCILGRAFHLWLFAPVSLSLYLFLFWAPVSFYLSFPEKYEQSPAKKKILGII